MSAVPSDTSPDAARVQIELLRRATTARRFELARSLSRTTIELSRRAIRRANPEWTEEQILGRWLELHYGRDIADQVRAHCERRSR